MHYWRDVRKIAGYVVILWLLITVTALSYAEDALTKINNTVIYSQYYPNPNAKFKGTLIFQNGSGVSLSEWTQNKIFFHCVRHYGNVFIYDRSGLGKSPADLSLSRKNPMTAAFVNRKLMMLLKKRNIKPPYILVAHSYGAMYAGYFARKHPDLVKGVLMIDPVPINYSWSNDFLKRHNTTQKQFDQMKQMTAKQLYTKYSFNITNKLNTMSAQLFYQLMGFSETKKQINGLPPIGGHIPVIILSSSYMEKNAPIQGDWFTLQKQWLSNNKKSIIIQVKSGHFIQLEHPKLICQKIKTLADLATKLN